MDTQERLDYLIRICRANAGKCEAYGRTDDAADWHCIANRLEVMYYERHEHHN